MMTTNNSPKLRFPEFNGEWEKKRLGEVAEISSGGTPSRTNPNFWNGDIPWVSTTLIDFNFIDKSEEYITEEGLKNSSAKLFPKGTLLMAMYGQGKTRGKVSILNIEASTNQACGAITTNSKILNSLFAFQNLAKRYVEIRDLSNQGGQENLSGGIIKSIELSFPTLPEQTRIASFFTVIDKKIAVQTQYIASLQQYKKGIMQKLFSQELRFKDEEGKDFPEWEEKKLGELNIYISDGNYGELYPRADQMVSQGVPFIRANNIKNLKLSMDDMKFINIEHHKVLTSGHLKTGDILVTTRGDIGMLAYVNEEFNNANINAQICLLRVSSSLNAKYLLYFLNSRYGIVQFKSLQTGSALKQLPKSNLSKILINLPCKSEQTKIANFLSAIDEKINHTENQIQKTQEWKKGLLQQMFC